MTGRKRKYKASKIRSFLFFLLLALVFWVLTKFSEESVATVYGKLSYTNLPNSVSVSSTNAPDVAFEARGNGFQFLLYSVKPPTLVIDLSRFYRPGDSIVHITSSEMNKIISSQIDSRVNSASVEDLQVQLDVIISQKVPVRFASELNFTEGFKAVGNPQIEPDSVTVSGPSVDVSEITEIATELLVRNNVSESINTELAIQPMENQKVTVSQASVRLQLKIEEFTQKQLIIPIELRNVPKEVNLKLLPETITLTFDVSISRFNSISVGDFSIVCDYESNTSEENIMVPKLIQFPEGLHHIEWSTKKVEYLIFK